MKKGSLPYWSPAIIKGIEKEGFGNEGRLEYSSPKKEAEDRWQVWGSLLNNIYGVLKNQLPAEEMKGLQTDLRNWLFHRDGMALKASEKYKGGTAEQPEYVLVLADLTEQRCYELVRIYMR